MCHAALFRHSPQVMYAWRRFLLRCFGAHVGKGVLIRPSASITYPWKVRLDDYCWVGNNVVLYSLAPISIGAHAVISQNTYLCGGDHDMDAIDFPLRAKVITVEEEAWVASDVFIAPGVTIGRGAVIGARSSVFKDMPAGMVCVGYPCRPIKRRGSR
jgi:putative colanic acid biosynthesis acetyltransferase WcaF